MSKPLTDMNDDEILSFLKELRDRRSNVADRPTITKGPTGKKSSDLVVTGSLAAKLDELFTMEGDE